MAVVAAAIESNGWVLRVDGVWDASTFASFDLDPDGVGRVRLEVTSAGHDRSGSTGVANSARVRTGIVGTKPLRQPYPNQALIDETDLGGGQRRVRIALSRYIYPGEPVSVAFAAGWRAGLAGATVVALNGSTYPKPLPSARWAVPQYMRQTAAFRVDLLVAHIEAEGKSAVAAVKLVGYDGTNTQQWWLTESVSTLYGDSLKCWGADIEPTALTAGLITLHWEVYPWIGAVRRSGTAHSTVNTDGFSTSAEAPLVVAWDPAGTRYPEAHVFIDPIGGSTTPSAGMVYASAAAAKAGNRAANWSVAQQAVYLANRSATAANGFAAMTRMLDNAVYSFAAGTHTFGSTSVTTGATNGETRIILQGDPTDSDQRASCILQTSASFSTRGNRYLIRNMTVEMGGSTFPTGSRRYHFDNVELRGKTGSETANNGLSTTTPAGLYDLSFSNCRWWKYGAGIDGSSVRAGLIRNVEFSRSAAAQVVCTSRRIEDSFVPAGGRGQVGGWSLSGDTAGTADTFVWGVRSFYNDNGGLNLPGPVTSAGPAAVDTTLRLNVVNSLFERIENGSGGATDPFATTAGYKQTVDCLIEGSTFVGARLNWGYCDPTDLVTPIVSTGNCIRNSHFDRRATKHDVFTANGGLTQGWSNLYCVNHEGNTLMNRISNSENFEHEFLGLRSLRDPYTLANQGEVTDWPRFSADRCRRSAQGVVTGGGDYRPLAGSPLIARGSRACIDVDQRGAARAAVFTAGAVEAEAVVAPSLATGSSLHGHLAAPAGVAWVGSVAAAPAQHGVAGGSAALVALGPSDGGGAGLAVGRVLTVGRDERTIWVDVD